MANSNFKRVFPNPMSIFKTLNFKMLVFPSRKRRLARALTIEDLRKIAKRRTPKGPFDYTDGAAESESSLDRTRNRYKSLQFVPSILRDVSKVDTSVEVLGEKFALPFGIAPTGFTRMMHAEGERAGAKAAEKFQIPFTLSTLGTSTIAEVVDAAPSGRNWFQLYMWRDREGSMRLVENAWNAGVRNLILTVDVPVAGARHRDTRNGLTIPPSLTIRTLIEAAPKVEWWWNFLTTPELRFASMSQWKGTVAELLDYMFDPSMSFEDLKWIRRQWKGTLSVKGIQNVDDAKKAAQIGVDAIVLSNHGGRQLDRAPIPLELVQQCRKLLGKNVEIHIDSGITRGSDVLAALALGADFAYIGRAYLYGLMAGGQEGVERSLEIMTNEITRTMKLLGVSSLKELAPKHINFA
ncbi:MAG: alpha-hydroxy-acid oxidizing protein [Actinobacteria bacterium]|nr:alpha-hydroxy-acid oxidizing protein [Actinomycetota bacterium]NCU82823.1 alpha-hydroxy-acid oxidizing protein [Actinomycetota bacterium]NDA57926.1 alpha-hydroxy-acid oxidizing protein [Actinomycetota bacterium]NDF43826.1 alpha-hydroxy-acid oxidizing protein [Actinomycetota bacterium]